MRRYRCARCGEQVSEPALSIHQRGGGLKHYCLTCADEVTGHKLQACAFCTQWHHETAGIGMCAFHQMRTANRENCIRFERSERNE